MAVQLPSEAIGPAAGVLVYSFFCLSLSLLLLWLVWVHHERKSYVAMLSFSMSLGTLASIVQQFNTIVNWNDVKTSQYENVVANVGRPELNVTGASTGLDLVLFYIQYYSYNVDAMLVVFWSVELANSILQLRSSKLNRLRGSLWAKASAIFLPVVQMNLLRLDVVQNSVLGYMVLADFIMIVSFAIGSLLLLAILIKYIHSRAVLMSWNVRYGQNSTQTTNPYSGNGSMPSGPRPTIPRRNIYDSWLAVRFTVAFVALGLFELVVIFFQLRATNTNTKENIPPEPDLSAARAQDDFALFVPGVSASLLIFIVFGTTRTFRDYLWTKFAPKPLQDMVANRKARQRQKSISEGKTMAPPVVLSTIQVGVKRSSLGPANNTAGDDFKGAQTLTTINGHEYRTGQYTNFIHSATPSPTASPGPGSEVDLETGNGNGHGLGHGGHGGHEGHGGYGSYGGNGTQRMHLQTTSTPFGVVRSTSRTDDDVPILKKAMPTFQRGYR
ncbi:hypothetical protein SMACR_00744 [Sordaria macrospora]|uniref:WGS project CABT00000000 data, contig 2.2 n=2 Tax=Sordaria macrospora TaxID=5147 RepID=F7VMY8_SORMK|nr:uncharacterized protein SMAC_00744 [Sordaria macrospora k-hell]KAA8634770.1 hypothetical protein SMACR_00744 [Sordaria macrospora]WPJ61740.1 hypothetical protein SMAC4_00744 [Sordaria macrospora]CCC06717.1 unnamed protein product [Sordaria macrospora k-hell]